MKVCNKCEREISLSEFHKDKTHRDGYHSVCKKCKEIYRINNKEHIDDKNKLNYIKNRLIIIEKTKTYYVNNKEVKKEYNKNYCKLKAKNNKIRKSKYYQNNKQVIGVKNRLYEKNKIKTDIVFKLKKNIGTAIRNSIKQKGYIKESRTFEILDCSFEYFKQHIESFWEPWMSWDNYGKYNGVEGYGWDIDHIIPLATAKTEEDVIRLNHYTNLQPLCSYINRVIKRNNEYKPKSE